MIATTAAIALGIVTIALAVAVTDDCLTTFHERLAVAIAVTIAEIATNIAIAIAATFRLPIWIHILGRTSTVIILFAENQKYKNETIVVPSILCRLRCIIRHLSVV